jgi:hypothetical protein
MVHPKRRHYSATHYSIPGFQEAAMINDLDVVVLTADLPEKGLQTGDIGTVVYVHGDKGYTVEFMTLDGETVAVVFLTPEQVRAVHPREMATVRSPHAV